MKKLMSKLLDILSPATTARLWQVSLDTRDSGGNFECFWFLRSALNYCKENYNSAYPFIYIENQLTEKIIYIKASCDCSGKKCMENRIKAKENYKKYFGVESGTKMKT